MARGITGQRPGPIVTAGTARDFVPKKDVCALKAQPNILRQNLTLFSRFLARQAGWRPIRYARSWIAVVPPEGSSGAPRIGFSQTEPKAPVRSSWISSRSRSAWLNSCSGDETSTGDTIRN